MPLFTNYKLFPFGKSNQLTIIIKSSSTSDVGPLCLNYLFHFVIYEIIIIDSHISFKIFTIPYLYTRNNESRYLDVLKKSWTNKNTGFAGTNVCSG